jgi:dihydroneopterin aldolase/2-amino-4-hydroxy-6-hydroxymethyldihydropteridine diphosphokinase
VTVAAYDLDENPAHPVRAVVALGANLGDRFATLQAALDDLAGFEGIRLQAVSPVLETAPVGGPDQPDYLNAVLLVDTTLSPLGLLAACQQVESEHGRTRRVRWGPRTLDLDLISYDWLVAVSPDLQVPHPGAAQRAFVLAPWLAVDPQACLPGPEGEQVPVGGLLSKAPDRDGLRPRPDLSLRVSQ